MNIISSVLHHLVLSPQAPAQDIWVSVKLGWPEMKTEETSADASYCSSHTAKWLMGMQ